MTAQALLFSRGTPVSGNSTSGATQFGSDGVMSGSSYSGPANWFTPAGGNVGLNYWLKITRTGGTASVTFGALQDTWFNLGSPAHLLTAFGAPGGCTGSWQLSPNSTGSPVVATGTLSVNNTI